MLVNLSDVMTKEGSRFHQQFEVDMNDFRYCGVAYPMKSFSFFDLAAENIEKGKAKIVGKMDVEFIIPCDRCLTDVDHKIQIEFERNTDEIEDFMEGNSLHIEQLVYSEILVEWPMKVLCKENCKGICKVCGQNFNLGTCTCDDFVPDPRMASIKDIFNANKEV